ncbi:MAG TPA: D-alanine--D-alanine ligase [Burkholderiales bacterium]|nr:D-alanine--D-alanine ligase [Burkholderiales bacterium]
MRKVSNFGKVAVLMGGSSAEREISLKSGRAVLAALKRRGVDAHAFDPSERPLEQLRSEGFDRAFIALHGRLGEDGTVQGALQMMGMAYTGSGVMASALAMDKWRTKLVWRAAGVRTPRFDLLHAESNFKAVARKLGLPLMVKPSCEGSSIGMSKVLKAERLRAAYRLAANYDSVVIAEQFVKGIELTASILDGQALPLIRVETPRAFYDYQAKYFANSTRYICPCGLSAKQEKKIQEKALQAYQVLGCRGWGRVDLLLDQRRVPYFIEVNTVPGMTDHSLVPMAARAAGLSFDDLVVRILESSHVE